MLPPNRARPLGPDPGPRAGAKATSRPANDPSEDEAVEAEGRARPISWAFAGALVVAAAVWLFLTGHLVALLAIVLACMFAFGLVIALLVSAMNESAEVKL